MEDIKIIPLAGDNLVQALSVLHESFESFNDVEHPDKWFPASLNPKGNTQLYQSLKIKDCRYFVAVNTKEQVIGTTGLYHFEDQPKEAWVGWYCVKPSEQGKGFGKKILEWTINKAKEEGNEKLKLYTRPDFDTALSLYDKFGFKDTKQEMFEGELALYKELSLI